MFNLFIEINLMWKTREVLEKIKKLKQNKCFESIVAMEGRGCKEK
jgi:hypothetical protein